MVEEHIYTTPLGDIHYWTGPRYPDRPSLIFLPGLTADRRLFAQQMAHFAVQYNTLVWDAPGHGASRPFSLTFSLMDMGRWLWEILQSERLPAPVLVGQSMGGYVAQCLLELHPEAATAFVAIDSAPLQRKYVTAAEIWMLRRCEPIYRLYPWKRLVRAAVRGCAETKRGQQIMEEMTVSYTRAEYCRLAGFGYRILGDAMAAGLAYTIPCPALLICGARDRAGSTRRYNRRWSREAGLPIVWIPESGHNANCDCPQAVNGAIVAFLQEKGLDRL